MRQKFVSIPGELAAEPFTHAQADGREPLPAGVELGAGAKGIRAFFVTTAQGQKVEIKPGEYVADEPTGTGCYPISAEAFARRWRLPDEQCEGVGREQE